MNRRERLRTETIRQINDIARRHMAERGAQGLSLRAIAREIGVTPGALYGYYAGRDDLITALIAESLHDLTAALESARSGASERPADALAAVGWEFRRWALAHPAEFQLVFGDPIAGYRTPADGPTGDVARRAGGVVLGVIAAALRDGGWLAPLRIDERPTYRAPVARWLAETYPDLPPAAVVFHLRFLARLHGLLCMEVYGHLRPLVEDATPLFAAELRAILTELGL